LEVLKKLEELKIQYQGYNKFDILGYIIYKRTYSRYDYDLGRKEEWNETIYRCLKSLVEDVKVPLNTDEIERLFKYHMEFKCSLAGRQLWQLGSKLVKAGYADSLYNCYFFEMKNQQAFLQIFEELMLGGGCGFGIQNKFIKQLPKIKKANIFFNNEIKKDNVNDIEKEFGYYDVETNTYFVGDSREGWVNLLDVILTSFFETGQDLQINTTFIRKEGERIKGFGGVSSGDKSLIKGFTEIVNILKSREEKQLSSVDVLDIVCLIASVVVSGNVRRSATIGIGDSDDIDFLMCKRWDKIQVPYWRSYVNISIESKEFPVSDLFWDTYKKDTEAIGLINIHNCKMYGRLGENKDLDRKYYVNRLGKNAINEDVMLDGRVSGVNPCGEITLEHSENCLLSEVLLPNVESYEEFIDICRLLYKVNKHISHMNFLYSNTQEVNRRNSRIGISLTGILDDYKKFLDWSDKAYNELREYDIYYSKKNNFNQSIKLTTIQPHGTKSLMFNVSSGLHPQHSKYYYRTIRFAKNDELLELCKDMGLKIENQMFYEGKKNGKDIIVEDENTKVVYFPRKARDNSILSDNLTTLEHLDIVAKAQEIWADNSTSVTVYYDKKDLQKIKEKIKQNWLNYKTISLLPKTHGFLQAPFIEISEREYNKYVSSLKEIDIRIKSDSVIDDLECNGGHCPVR
jgi:hypothetical protein